MNKDFYISSIAKKLSNELNAAELKDLSVWLSADKANSASLDSFKKTWDLTQDYRANEVFDVDSAFESFSAKYDIPHIKESSNIKPKSRNRMKSLPILLVGLFLISLSIVGTTLYDKYINNSNDNVAIANNEMFAQSYVVNDAVSVTMSPNSNFAKGDYIISSKKTNSDLSDNTNTSGNNSFDSLDSNVAQNNSSTATFNNETDFNSPNENFSVENFYGQGYFDVHVPTGTEAAKILIENGRFITTENSTFNLQNYKEDDFTVIDVQTGSLTFITDDNVLTVREGQRLVFNEKTATYKTVKLPNINPFQWHKGTIVFDNTDLEDAFSMIERFYGVNISIIDDSSLENHNYTATFYKSSNLNDCLELLSESIGMDIERISERDIHISNIHRK